MLEERIMLDFKESMKAKDQLRTQTISFLRSELKYYAINNKKEKLEDGDVISVLKKMVKQRQDSITQFEKGQRMDLVEKEKNELEILKAYLPQDLSEQELERFIEEALVATHASSIKDMGKVIKEVMSLSKGRADGKMVSEFVRKKLGA
ncbi:MAG: GatB/YqeY domain-containing protein [Candidatus Omnitrophota bacterium]